jgi:hypothetical protein
MTEIRKGQYYRHGPRIVQISHVDKRYDKIEYFNVKTGAESVMSLKGFKMLVENSLTYRLMGKALTKQILTM